ncbi:NAD(P)-dependent oxidoreductase [Candidatus Woesearchaeota archaeon]|nr:NAD(P)-dependent oxidoreductase [Candidatus Woesearchaeota archaeon]
MNILVTGGLGHIGSQLIRELANRKDVETIRILDNLLTQRYCSLFYLPEGRYEFIEGDITDAAAVRQAMQDIDMVVHLAAITDAPSTIAKPEETHKVNYIGTEIALHAALQASVKKFLFPSTTSVYGEAEGIVDEDSPEEIYKPASPYATAKFAAEKLVKNAYLEHGLHTTVLRMGTIFGTSIGMRFHTAVNKFCYLAALGRPLTVWEDALDQKRPYLGLNDAARAFAFIEQHGKAGELYNVVTENYTVRQVVDAIRAVVPDVQIQLTKSPILNQKSYHVASGKIRKLGFAYVDNLDEQIKNTINLFRGIHHA